MCPIWNARLPNAWRMVVCKYIDRLMYHPYPYGHTQPECTLPPTLQPIYQLPCYIAHHYQLLCFCWWSRQPVWCGCICQCHHTISSESQCWIQDIQCRKRELIVVSWEKGTNRHKRRLIELCNQTNRLLYVKKLMKYFGKRDL